jgi:hypothetical protein
MGWMVTVIKDGETLIIKGGQVLIRAKPGKFAALALNPSPDAEIKKTGTPKDPEDKRNRG